MFGEGDDANLGEARQRYEQILGLDQPLPVQYVRFLGEIVRFDFGNSIVRGGEPVSDMIARALPLTIELAIVALIIALAIAIPVAILSALKQNTLWDRGGTALALIGVSLPSFWQGIMLILFFAVYIPILPVSGVVAPHISIERITGMAFTDAVLTGNWEAAWDVARHLVLPAVTLGTAVAAQFVRVLRSSLLEVKHQDFIDAFRARGLGERTIVRHMLHNALPTTAVIVGLRVGALLSGTIVIETVFAYPGMGHLLIQAINARDFPVVQGVVVLLTVMVIFSNLAADVVHGWLDPRIKLSEGAT
jgi:dipeptide transport system permease protein